MVGINKELTLLKILYKKNHVNSIYSIIIYLLTILLLLLMIIVIFWSMIGGIFEYIFSSDKNILSLLHKLNLKLTS